MLISTVLVVDDDLEVRSLLEAELAEAGYRALSAASGHEALERLSTQDVDVVVTDLIMSGMLGNELLTAVRAKDPDLPVIVMTAFGSIDSAVASMKAGAFHYIPKPFPIDRLMEALEAALRNRRLQREMAELRDAAQVGRTTMVAESAAMRRAQALIDRAAPTDVPVLILGESGTGKELLAQALHLGGPRRDGPFVAVNCSAIPESLLESQLFGHRRGSFTDARESRRGLFQEAQGGTVLLDEIGDMPLALQAKILRVLQQKEIHPLGAPAPIPVDIRVVAATHRDPEALCAEGRFRHDLYYRLNVIAVRIPPLRERPQDIKPLAAHFLRKHREHLGCGATTVSLDAMMLLERYAWPGNVRELENVIARALVLGSGDAIRPEDLPDALIGRVPGAAVEPVRLLTELERDQIVRVLRSVAGNKTAAARLLGVDRKTLYRKLDLYGIRER